MMANVSIRKGRRHRTIQINPFGTIHSTTDTGPVAGWGLFGGFLPFILAHLSQVLLLKSCPLFNPSKPTYMSLRCHFARVLTCCKDRHSVSFYWKRPSCRALVVEHSLLEVARAAQRVGAVDRKGAAMRWLGVSTQLLRKLFRQSTCGAPGRN